MTVYRISPSTWSRQENRFVIEASTLRMSPDVMSDARPISVQCPNDHCDALVSTSRHVAMRDVTHRDGVCGCGAYLMILND